MSIDIDTHCVNCGKRDILWRPDQVSARKHDGPERRRREIKAPSQQRVTRRDSSTKVERSERESLPDPNIITQDGIKRSRDSKRIFIPNRDDRAVTKTSSTTWDRRARAPESIPSYQVLVDFLANLRSPKVASSAGEHPLDAGTAQVSEAHKLDNKNSIVRTRRQAHTDVALENTQPSDFNIANKADAGQEPKETRLKLPLDPLPAASEVDWSAVSGTREEERHKNGSSFLEELYPDSEPDDGGEGWGTKMKGKNGVGEEAKLKRPTITIRDRWKENDKKVAVEEVKLEKPAITDTINPVLVHREAGLINEEEEEKKVERVPPLEEVEPKKTVATAIPNPGLHDDSDAGDESDDKTRIANLPGQEVTKEIEHGFESLKNIPNNGAKTVRERIPCPFAPKFNCNMVFHRHADAVRHVIERHKDMRSPRCPICNKGFSRVDEAMLHECDQHTPLNNRDTISTTFDKAGSIKRPMTLSNDLTEITEPGPEVVLVSKNPFESKDTSDESRLIRSKADQGNDQSIGTGSVLEMAIEALEPVWRSMYADYDDQESISSVPSLTTGATQETVVSAAATAELARALFQDLTLKQVFETVVATRASTRKTFEVRMQAAIKSFAVELEKEVKDRMERFAVNFLSTRPKAIARKLSIFAYSRDQRLELEQAGPDIGKQQLIGRFLLDQSKSPGGELLPHASIRKAHEQDDSDDEDDLQDEEIEIKELERILNFIMTSRAMIALRRIVKSFVLGQTSRFPAIDIMEGHSEENMVELEQLGKPSIPASDRDALTESLKEELGSCVVYELQNLSEDQVKFHEHDPLTVADHLKTSLESFSGQAWNWRPFDPPRKILMDHLVRMQWRCSCGELRSKDINPALAEDCRELLKKNARLEDAGFRGESLIHRELKTGHAVSPRSSSIEGAFRGIGRAIRNLSGTTYQYLRALEAINKPFQLFNRNHPSQSQATLATEAGTGSPTSPHRWILLCSFRGYHVRPGQIEVTAAMYDDVFFIALRKEVRRLRGFWRWYMHPKQFHHCSFAKYTRIFVNRFVKYDEQELPECQRYHYEPRASKIDPQNPTVCPHEWYDRFYNHQYTGGFCRVIQRIPKRDERFTFHLHEKEEDMWGLNVELRISAAIVLAWLLFIAIGGLVFFIWWMKIHDGDWQSAAVPLTITMMAWGSVFIPLNEHFNRSF